MTLRFKPRAMSRKRHSNPRPLQRTAGISLVEILVVLAIIGLVLGLVGPRVIDQFGKSRARAAEAQIALFVTALDLYRLDVGRYPDEKAGLDALVRRPEGVARWAGPYLGGRGLPDDPWGNAWIYRVPGPDGAAFEILSQGADGRPGGEGENADISGAG